ncbi:amino acid permease [Paenactinomyces guangxiensis]|uniref:Amino acid permease n=1 Tax=Paenactinomyces guangxiensis TaxID=1490290 RepID=A0A7W1WTD1_9BACL|nr:amino acid permease [Paenactinomyces guangxiensis]MBA4495715.1 amino acid permease [Paenactinomyces guangxiensis]MBH8592704.1 amino acid permease [Paenactinomyces guangxiensis]
MKITKPYVSIHRPHTHYEKKKAERRNKSGITENQLVFIGVGSILGAGFFLATANLIRETGPSVLLAYLIGLFAVWTIFEAMGEMLVLEPGHKGSFLSYVEKYLGRGYGFAGGWLYWIAGILIMSSEVTAIGLFTQKWLPFIPVWLLSAIYTLLALGINLIGLKNYGKIESLFGAVKIGAVILFTVIVIGCLLFGHTRPAGVVHAADNSLWFTRGPAGFLSSLSIMFFTFGGVISTGMASSEIEDHQRIPSAFRKLVALLGVLYLLSLGTVLVTAPVNLIFANQSPFVTTLMYLKVPFADHILNAAMITAAFSTMTATMFAVSRILVNLGLRHEAPSSWAKSNRKGIPLKALLINIAGLFISIVISFFLPDVIYELLTTAAGVVLLLLWGLILWTQYRFRRKNDAQPALMWGYPLRSLAAIIIIAIAIISTAFDPEHMISLTVSIGLAVLVTFIYFLIRERIEEGTENIAEE